MIQKCRICGSEDIKFDRELKSFASDRMLSYFICNNCGTIMESANEVLKYEEESLFNSPFAIKHYVETGAGLFCLALQMQLIKKTLNHKLGFTTKNIKYLDVGTGFGFSVLMAQQLGWDAVGVEPSAMGKIGREMLGLNDIVSYYLEDSNLPESCFDIITSSEVIEHVPHPDDFIQNIKKYLTPKGLILLTTPNSDVIKFLEEEWLECYSPGFHLNIFSPDSMKLLLNRNGFEDVKIFLSEGSSGKKRMIILAAREEGTIPDNLNWNEVLASTKTFLKNVLENLVAKKEASNQQDDVYSGALYRLVDLLVNTGNFQESKEYIEKIDKIIQSYGIDVDSLLTIQAESLEEYVKQVPAYAGYYFFYKGIFHLNHTKNYQEALGCFRVALHLCQVQENIGYLEGGWNVRAKVHEGIALLYSGNQSAAIQIFNDLLKQPDVIQKDVIESLYWSKGIAHLQLRENHQALESFIELLLKKHPEYPPSALHMAMALNQSVEELHHQIDNKLTNVEDLHHQIDDKLASLAEENIKAIDDKLKEVTDKYHQGQLELIQKIEKYEVLIDQGINKFNVLTDRVNRVTKILDTMISAPKLITQKIIKPRSITISEDGSEVTVGELLSGRVIEQELIIKENNISQISLKIGTFERLNTSQLYVDILDEGKKQIKHIAKSASVFEDNQLHTFSFAAIPDSQGKKYWLRVSSNAATGNAVTLWCKRQQGDTLLSIDNKRSKNTLIYELGFNGTNNNIVTGVKDILIITPDKLGKIRIGLGMRHWEIAKALTSKGLDVTLATPHPIPDDLQGEGFDLYSALSPQKVLDVAQEYRVVMVQGDVLRRYPELEKSDKKIIVDMVTPFHIEDIEKGQKEFENGYSVIRQCLARGDFFVCGNESQRVYWLGMLTALGRINKQVRDQNAAFYKLIDVAGFGIPEQPPVKSAQVLKGVFSNIHEGDFVLMWMGGIWDWLDPLTLIQGVHQAHQKDERVKLFFPAYRQSNGQPSNMAKKARDLCVEIGALDKSVFFNEYPIPYEERVNYLLESDVGVVCQAANFETQISARTRVLDYIWTGLPILINEGDEWCELVRRHNLGVVVPGNSADDWGNAIIELAANAEARQIKVDNIAQIQSQYQWNHLVEPIINYVKLGVNN